MDQLRDRQKMNWEAMFYSSQRIDLLIIAISGTGIYVCLETLKFAKENYLESIFWIKVSGVLFVLSIIVNFISQFYGRKSNEQDYLVSQLLLENKVDNKKDLDKNGKEEYDEYQSTSKKYTKYTNRFNYTSAVSMSIGLVLLVIYFVFIF
jgi:hypothetical protein